MKIKNALLLAAMASVVSAPVLADDVMKVYGQVNLSLDNTSLSGSGLSTATTYLGRKEGSEVLSNASRLGMMGSLDTTLENTKMIYQAELEYSSAGPNSKTQDATKASDNSLFVREAYAGLDNKDYGMMRLGRLTVGYKSSYTGIDPWTDHVLQARQSGQQGASDLNANYFNNAIEYVSPKFNDFQLNAHYSTLADESTDALHNAGQLANFKGGTASGFGVKYVTKTLRLTADILNLDSDSQDNKPAKTATNGQAMQVTGKYNFSTGTSLAALYEDVTDLHLGTNVFAIVTQKVGQNGLLTASYGVNQGDKDSVYGENDATTMNVGSKYMLTKNSSIFAAYSQTERDTNAGLARSASTITVGIDAKFGY